MLIGCELIQNGVILGDFFRLLAVLQGGQHFNFIIKKVFAVQIKEAIRTPGMHLVPVKLHQKVTAELKVHVGEA